MQTEKVKIQALHSSRRNSEINTLFGEFKFNSQGVAEVDVQEASNLMEYNVGEFQLLSDRPLPPPNLLSDFTAQKPSKDRSQRESFLEQENLVLQEKIDYLETKIDALERALKKFNGGEEKIEEVEKKIDEVDPLKDEKIDYNKSLAKLLLPDLQAIAEQATFPKEEWGKLLKADLIRYIIQKEGKGVEAAIT